MNRAGAVRSSLGCVVALVFATSLDAQEPLRVASPDGRNVVTVEARDGGLFYRVDRDGRPIILPSRLGFIFRGAPPLRDSLRVTGSARATYDSTWTQPWGEVARVRDHHDELRVSVSEATSPQRRFDVVFRVFDDGLGFRYELPAQPALGEFEMMEELTEFTLADNGKAWWIASNRPRLDRSEQLFSSSPASVLDSVQTPLTIESSDGRTVLVIHEADLEDYARMFLAGPRGDGRTFRAALAPWADGVKVRGRTPFLTPWRTIQLADRVEDLVPSVLGLNLNPPSRIQNTSWIKPMKYDGIWWGMHIGRQTWSSGPKHGATTENARQYIDFAAANGLGGTLVEGWNLSWDPGAGPFSYTKAYPDYDLAGVAAYARSKGVHLIAHNETNGGVENYQRQLEDAFRLYHSLGIDAVKSGYVADLVGGGNSHYGQYMVRHQRLVIETAAKYGIMLDVHEPIHDTGERRTYPNMMTREGARGQEYNAWSADGGNPPEHESILFFTRLLDGPMDYTPGIFDVLIKSANGTPRTPDQPRPRTTLARQLALYLVLYSPLQMAADLPENYANQPAFQFIRDVPTDWERTKVLVGKIGDYVVVARQRRGGEDWYIGAVTDEQRRTLEVPLDFLAPGRKYTAQLYADGPGADWRDNPLAIAISSRPVDSATRLTLELAPGGGAAIRIVPAQ